MLRDRCSVRGVFYGYAVLKYMESLNHRITGILDWGG